MIEDQKPPIKNDSLPIWPLVIEDTNRLYAHRKQTVCRLTVKDMEERDKLGLARYGVRLQAFNGRNQLIDAYQEALDLCVYLRTVIAEGNPIHDLFEAGISLAIGIREIIMRDRG